MSTSPAPRNERRLHPRLAHNVPVKISSGDVDIVTETRDLSCSGAFCRVNRYIAPMTKLKLTLLLPLRKNNKIITKRIHCEGAVVRTEAVLHSEEFQTAIFFSDISPRDSRVIGEFVDSLLTEKPHG